MRFTKKQWTAILLSAALSVTAMPVAALADEPGNVTAAGGTSTGSDGVTDSANASDGAAGGTEDGTDQAGSDGAADSVVSDGTSVSGGGGEIGSAVTGSDGVSASDGAATAASDGATASSAASSGETSEEAAIEAFYKDTVFIGDSIMLGFRNYAMQSEDPVLKELEFLASGRYGVNTATIPIGQQSFHPYYQGEERYLWDSVGMMGAKRLFIMFGMNDLDTSRDNTAALYKQLLEFIISRSPDIDVNIISMTYVLHGAEKGKLNNDYIRKYNQSLQQMAAENGWHYVDFASALSTANGDLPPEYCSDNFVHLTNAAYDVWVSLLRSYAASRIAESAS